MRNCALFAAVLDLCVGIIISDGISFHYARVWIAFASQLSDTSLLRRFGSKGVGKGQFDRPMKLCFSAKTDLILIAEDLNCRVQEVTLAGKHHAACGNRDV